MLKYTDSIFGAFNFVSETGGKEDYREILPQNCSFSHIPTFILC